MASPRQWASLLLGLSLIYALFHGAAMALGSERGEAGLLIAAIVVGATLGIERLVFSDSMASATRTIGLGRPRGRGLVVSAVACGVLLLMVPAFAAVTGATVTAPAPGLALLPGLFAQGGVAEEVLFRGYLFGHVRAGRTFWRAATVSMLPFVAVHLLLFLTLPPAIAAAAVAVAVITSFPMAHLFELGGGTIWPSALLHFVVQGTVKVLVVTGNGAAVFPLVWMAGSAFLPLLTFIVTRQSLDRPSASRGGRRPR